MNLLDQLLKEPTPYSLDSLKKNQILEGELEVLTKHHSKGCAQYRRILSSFDGVTSSGTFPLPVRLFKMHRLSSVPKDEEFKVLTSSGTTSQAVSQIVLDKKTASMQTKVLVNIMQSYLGKQRLPMLIIDHPNVIKDRKSFSARGAGILGLSNFGRDHTYALTDDMELNVEAILKFSEKYKGQPTFVFGFTFMVWQYFVEEIKNKGIKFNLDNSILIHSGGWKKLIDKAVDNDTFKEQTRKYTGINRIHNFYGMVEQVGSIFVECEHGFLHAPNFANIKIVSAENLKNKEFGEKGLIQVESILPTSYPGHVLLTEDTGTIIGEDDCQCGRKGRYFTVHGRLPKAEVRGCSDTHEKK